MRLFPKTAATPLVALFSLAMTPMLAARENPYDVLGKVLMPIASVFAMDAQGGKAGHALVLDAHLVEASKLPPELQGQSAHVALLPPDCVLVQAPIAGEVLTVCRNGDDFWAEPGSKIQYLIDQLPATGGKKKKKHEAEAARALGPLALPVPQKELVFLPILFQVADAGDDTAGAVPCQVLDVQLMPQLAKSAHAEGWSARLWVGPNYSLVKASVTGPDWKGTVAVDKLTFPQDLPAATFQPQGTDVLKLTGPQFIGLMGRIGRAK
jgi:hypothetical protein